LVDKLEDVSCAKAKKRAAASNVLEVVVRVCYAKLSNVFSSIVIGMTDKTSLVLDNICQYLMVSDTRKYLRGRGNNCVR
jgi:hypothetical protein